MRTRRRAEEARCRCRGLLITFIELIKNPRYSFWSHSFVSCAPEIEKLFESVARSCMGAGAAGPGGPPAADGAAPAASALGIGGPS